MFLLLAEPRQIGATAKSDGGCEGYYLSFGEAPGVAHRTVQTIREAPRPFCS